jgi:hypothetical protein
MVDDRRLTFSRKWLGRAELADDPFDRFFSAWIALIALAQRLQTRLGIYLEADSDRQLVVAYFREQKGQVLVALALRTDQMRALARRRGTTHRNPILDTGNRKLRDQFAHLANHYSDATRMDDTALVVAVAELLNKVRNNTFHGIKVYDDREDVDLLTLVNPVLMEILYTCDPDAAPRQQVHIPF